MRFILYLMIVGFSLFLGACREELNFETSTGTLRFSKDTLVLDTVYNQTRSETYAIKIYNDKNKDIKIPKIRLAKGKNSMYKINVDGRVGTEFQDVNLRRKDSLYIFVEIAPIANAPEAVEVDEILFGNAGEQRVTLMSVVQDAEFFASTKEKPLVITENTVWTHQKAKIILGELTLAEGKTLSIEKGTKVYFYKNSGLKISKNAILNITGDYKEEVILRGERNSLRYDTIPANWNGIKLDEGAKAQISYAKISGGNTALNLYKASANIKNTIIHTFENYGIYGISSNISAQNLVVNNCGQATVGIFAGGSYQLIHTTLANYSSGSLQAGLGIEVQQTWENGTQTIAEPLSIELKNSIVYTKGKNSITLQPAKDIAFNYLFENSLIKYGDQSIAGFSWENNPRLVQMMKNEDPLFINHHTEKMNLRLAPQSPAIGKGSITTARQVPLDISKKSRLSQPDLGAYQN